MKIKVDLTSDEIMHLGFKNAMNLKWRLEDQLDYLVTYDEEAKELINEIQKNQKN